MTGLDEGYFKGMWGRALGSDYSETGKSSAFGNTRSNGQFGGLQMGIDFYRGITDGGSRIHFGGYAGHLWSGTSDFTVTPIHRGPVGTTRSDGWVAGGYLTYYTPSGFYVDAVVQGDWLNHRLNAADGTSARTKSNGLLGSVEMGKSFGSSWKFEPQVQVIYSTSNVDNFTDSAGVLNRIDNDNSWTGRAGFRLKRTWDNNPNSDGGLFTFYGKANIWGRLDGGTSTLTVGVSNPGAVQYKGVWGDVGVGTTFSIGKGAEFFTDADVEFGIDQGATALSGRAGFRLKF
jgi:outer membrane autotransporter protein